jgi:signal transduction histidine kinase
MARIILIDDDAGLRKVLGEILAEGGHEVVTAADGAEGLEKIRAAPLDLVLCDINMPVLDGFGVLEAIRADPRQAALPFVFLTSETDVRAGIVSGADDYLMKPVPAGDLLAAVEARLARREAARKEADRRVGEVRRTVAALLPHELRTPLTTILGSGRLLQEFHRDFGPDEIGEMAAGIVQAALRLQRMTENYILYADLEAWRLSTGGRERLSGASGAAEVESAAMEVAAQRGRSGDLSLELSEVSVPVGSAYLRKAVTELVDNALKFSPAGTRVHVLLARAGSAARLEVVDQGRGMTADQVGRLGAFQQFDRDRFEQQGSGMGLVIVRGIAEASGGRCEVESGPGVGATVRIRWPADLVAAP